MAGISIDDAVYRAKMPRAVIEALESDDFGVFSSPLYARSFLKQYAEYVGADVDPWLDDFVPTVLIDGQASDTFIDISNPNPVKKKPLKQRSSGGTMAAVWMLVITSALIWGGIKGYAYLEEKVAEEEAALSAEKNANAEPEETPAAEAEVSAEGTTADSEEEKEETRVVTSARRAIIVEEE